MIKNLNISITICPPPTFPLQKKYTDIKLASMHTLVSNVKVEKKKKLFVIQILC